MSSKDGSYQRLAASGGKQKDPEIGKKASGDDDDAAACDYRKLFAGCGTRNFGCGYMYGIGTMLILQAFLWGVGFPGGGSSPGPSQINVADFGDGRTRGGYRWPTKPLIEPASGMQFKAEAKGLNSEFNMLMGVGLRVKKVLGLGVKVYAVGFYIDPVGARRALRQYKDHSVAGLRSSQAFYDKLTDAHSFRKVLELVFLRNVGMEKLKDTFNEGLAVRMREKMGSKGNAILKDFISVFKDMKTGQKLIFAVEKGVLSVKSHKGPVHKFASPELASSLLELYFGENPSVGAEVKENLIGRVPAIWVK